MKFNFVKFNKIVSIIFVLIVFLISSESLLIAQTSSQFYVFYTEGKTQYKLSNFETPFDLFYGSQIPASCLLSTENNSFLEIHSDNQIIRLLPQSIIEIKNGNFFLLKGYIYINTLKVFLVDIEKTKVAINPGVVVLGIDKVKSLYFITDSSITLNNEDIIPSKSERTFQLIDNKFVKSKQKISLKNLEKFDSETSDQIYLLNNLVDIFLDRFFKIVEKNNSFIKVIDESTLTLAKQKEEINELLPLLVDSHSNIKDRLMIFSNIYQTINEKLEQFNLLKAHYLEYYFQVKNYIEYFKRLIIMANQIKDLDNFNEFPDFKSRSDFFIAYGKLSSLVETAQLTSQIVESTYVNIINPLSPPNLSYLSLQKLKNQIVLEFESSLTESFKDLSLDILAVIKQTLFIQLDCKSLITINFNQLNEIKQTLVSEYNEDFSVINPLFSFDDIMYKSLLLMQADEITSNFFDNYDKLSKNIEVLNYLSRYSDFINPQIQEVIKQIIEIYPSYENNLLLIKQLNNEIKKDYARYQKLLSSYIKKSELAYYQSIFIQESTKYISYIEIIQKEYYKEVESGSEDPFHLMIYLNIQKKIVSVVKLMNSFLSRKFTNIIFSKKLEFEQIENYLATTEKSIKQKYSSSFQANTIEKTTQYLIVAIVASSQVINNIQLYRSTLKDLQLQKENLQKNLSFYTLSIADKDSFDATTFNKNLTVFSSIEKLLLNLDILSQSLDKFETAVVDFNNFIQNFYLIDMKKTENMEQLNQQIAMLKSRYNEFISSLFAVSSIINDIEGNIEYLRLNSNNSSTLDLISELSKLIYTYQSKIEILNNIFSIINILFTYD
ncbi:MAG: hypothetical protein KBG82_03080 [Spirochaetes bacterium]|nr:hypothetical protein [Spirochaetota bacterium]HOV46164.1 hypothetical protein [Exilispira sp.]